MERKKENVSYYGSNVERALHKGGIASVRDAVFLFNVHWTLACEWQFYYTADPDLYCQSHRRIPFHCDSKHMRGQQQLHRN